MKYQFFVILGLLGILNGAQASEFKLRSNLKIEVINSVLGEIENEIPLKLKQVINREVKIKFQNLNSTPILKIDDNCTDHIILGRDTNNLSNNQIEVDNVFINELDNPNRPINCAHKTIRNYFKATIVHELAHLFDQELKISSQPLFFKYHRMDR